jgi:hypothetical protein
MSVAKKKSSSNTPALPPPFSNKVFNTLQQIPAAARQRLLRYLHSPYFNQSKTLTHLCEWLLGQIERGQFHFTKEDAWKKIVPKAAYDDVNFRKYCSDLLALIEGFMAQEMLAQQRGVLETETLRYVQQNKIAVLYSSAVRSARSGIEETGVKSADFYRKAYQVERQYYALMDYDVQLHVRTNIEEASHLLDIYYWSEKLKLYCTVLSRQKTSTFQYHIDFIEEVLGHLESVNVEATPQLAIYFYIYNILKYPEKTEYYFFLKDMISRHAEGMNQQEALEIFNSALVYCSDHINRGDRRFMEEYFDVFNRALELGLFTQDGQMTPWRYNNIVGVVLRLGKTEWGEAFVEKYQAFLPADTRHNTYTFNLARIHRYQGRFEKVLQLLSNVEYEDIGYNLISKAMLVITYYELGEFEALSSFLDAFKNFLSRQKDMPDARRNGYLNLIKYVRRLLRLPPGDKVAVAQIREQLEQEKAVTVNFEWLFEKIQLLEK